MIIEKVSSWEAARTKKQFMLYLGDGYWTEFYNKEINVDSTRVSFFIDRHTPKFKLPYHKSTHLFMRTSYQEFMRYSQNWYPETEKKGYFTIGLKDVNVFIAYPE